jgi:hypothetical protein
MKIEGCLIDNLQAAVASARRLHGHPVYKDTQVYWSELLAMARAERGLHSACDQTHIDLLIAKLQQELAERGAI